MDESAPIRAITIGVSILLAIATISGVLMYYNTAKQAATNIGRGQMFAENYEQRIQDILITGSSNISGQVYITGTDVKNLLNYFYDDQTVRVDLRNVKVMNTYDESSHVPKASIVSGGVTLVNANLDGYNNSMKSVIDNQSFKISSNDVNSANVRVIVIDGIL